MSCGGRRMRRFEIILAALLALVVAAAAATEESEQRLQVLTWGGAYEAAQKAAIFDPFEAETGVAIETVPYDGGIAALMDGGAADGIDVVDMLSADARRACVAGLLAPFDAGILAPAPDGTPPAADFIDDAIRPCSVVQLVYATVIAYDDRAFPGVKPERAADFFDLERFPGKRALQKRPTAALEWALYAYGVPRQQIYDLLSTERGLDLAFRRLDEIREAIVWWQAGDEPPALLASGEVAMASGYNGRFFNAQLDRGAPITVIWDGQLLDRNVWAVPTASDDPELAQRFIRFATDTERLADFANRISYGPARYSAQQRIGLHREAGIAMRDHLPTTARHLEAAIRQDHAWYARTAALRQRRFDAWLAAGEDED